MLFVPFVQLTDPWLLGHEPGYLSNLLKAIGLGADPVLARVAELVALSDRELTSIVEAATALSARSEDYGEARLRQRVARMRGVLTTL